MPWWRIFLFRKFGVRGHQRAHQWSSSSAQLNTLQLSTRRFAVMASRSASDKGVQLSVLALFFRVTFGFERMVISSSLNCPVANTRTWLVMRLAFLFSIAYQTHGLVESLFLGFRGNWIAAHEPRMVAGEIGIYSLGENTSLALRVALVSLVSVGDLISRARPY